MSTEPGAELIAAHYQKTYERTQELWRERNRSFALLLLTIGLGAILASDVETSRAVVARLLSSLASLPEGPMTSLASAIPHQLVMTVMNVAVLYFMVTLHYRTSIINCNYAYLAGLETDLRDALRLGDGVTAFTRVGAFYWKHRGHGSSMVPSPQWTWAALLAFLLVIFDAGAIWVGISAIKPAGPGEFVAPGNPVVKALLFLANLGLCGLGGLYWWAYARSTVGFDRQARLDANQQGA